MKKKSKLNALLDDNRILAIISLLIAILIWSIVTLSIKPDTTRDIHNVPVNFGYDSGRYTSLGLDIVSEPEISVSLVAEGDGSVLGSMTSEDYVVYPDYTAVKNSGDIKLNLLVKITNPQLERRVSLGLAPGTETTVDVVFDAMETKEFPVVVAVNDLKMAEGFVLNKTSATPATISVSGPMREIEQIDHVVAEVTIDEEIVGSKSVPVQLKAVNKDYLDVNLEYASMSSSSAEVQLSVHQVAELPLTVEFINTPPGFDIDSLPYALSRETLEISGPASVVANLTELSVGYFDLADFALDKDYQLNVNLPNGIVSQENLNTVTLSFDSSGLAQKTLNVSNIRAINVPSNYQMHIETKSIANVTLVGPKEEIEKLGAANVVARINAEDIQVAVGQQNLAVQIYVPSSSSIFAIGNYTVPCDITSQ